MLEKQVRFNFEFSYFPALIKENPTDNLASLLRNPGEYMTDAYANMLRTVFNAPASESPYTEKDFKAQTREFAGKTAYIVHMPEKGLEEGLCKDMYFVMENGVLGNTIFTIEKVDNSIFLEMKDTLGISGDTEDYMICGIAGAKHYNFGSTDGNIENVLKVIATC